jgi:hypothetical protein
MPEARPETKVNLLGLTQRQFRLCVRALGLMAGTPGITPIVRGRVNEPAEARELAEDFLRQQKAWATEQSHVADRAYEHVVKESA